MAHRTSQFCPSLPFQACSCDYLSHFSLKKQRETCIQVLSCLDHHLILNMIFPQPGSPFFLFFSSFFFFCLVIFHSSTSDQISLARCNPTSSEALKNIFTVKEDNTRRKTNGHNRFSQNLYLVLSSLDQEDPQEKEMATHSSTLAWKIPWMKGPGSYCPWGCKELDTTERLHFILFINVLSGLLGTRNSWI